jgi:putative chitinase
VDRDTFLGRIRVKPFGGILHPPQVDGITAILDAWEAHPDLTDLRWLAYMLATTFWETSKSMQPVREAYYLGEPRAEEYRKSLRYFPFYGRGLVQITWRENYDKFSGIVGVDLLNDPDAALRPEIAIKIMFEGMARGLFTGLSLLYFFNGHADDPVGARQIINSMDHTNEIAEIYRAFLEALST